MLADLGYNSEELDVQQPPLENLKNGYSAIDVARQQSVKSWKLHATISLVRLGQRQGKHHEARSTLSAIYNWFTEGFNAADLQEAKELLEELSD
jgi:predicted ATPase